MSLPRSTLPPSRTPARSLLSPAPTSPLASRLWAVTAWPTLSSAQATSPPATNPFSPTGPPAKPRQTSWMLARWPRTSSLTLVSASWVVLLVLPALLVPPRVLPRPLQLVWSRDLAFLSSLSTLKLVPVLRLCLPCLPLPGKPWVPRSLLFPLLLVSAAGRRLSRVV